MALIKLNRDTIIVWPIMWSLKILKNFKDMKTCLSNFILSKSKVENTEQILEHYYGLKNVKNKYKY